MSDNRTCRCGRRMVVLSSRRVGDEQARYLACRTCGYRRTVVVDASEVFRRLSTVEQEQLGGMAAPNIINPQNNPSEVKPCY